MVEVASGLDHPWGLAFLPDGRLLVTERPGRLRTVTAEGRLDAEPIAGVPKVRASGQGGLLDVALHPGFGENAWVYLSYAAGNRHGVGTEVARGRLRGNRLEDVEVLFRALPKSGGGRHFGSRLRFAPDGHLFVTLGDRATGTAPRTRKTTRGASSAFATTAPSRPTIHSSGSAERAPRSSPPATATCRASRSTRRRAPSGRTSTGRGAATS